MARVTVEDCLNRVRDQFALVHLTAQRYRQLHRGASRLVENKNKNVVCALREIAADRVRFRENVAAVLLAEKPELVSQRLQKLIDTGNAENPTAAQAEAIEEVDNPTPLI